MSWQDEWEQHKAAAQRKSGAGTGGAQPDESGTRLAGADGPPDSWSSRGKLKSSKAAWSKAGSDTGALAGNVRKSLATLAEKQTGSISGVRTAAAQRKVYQSWKRYLEDVSKRCQAIEARMEKAGNDGYKTDEDINAAFAAMKKEYQDTDALGGAQKGR